MRGTADMYVGLSDINRQYNNLQLAEQYLVESKAQGEYTGFPQNPYRWHVAMAGLQEMKGDLAGALHLLNQAERWCASDFYPNVRPLAALKARVLVAQGKLDEAIDWVREQNLSVYDDLSYLREFRHVSMVRVFLAQYQRKPDSALLAETMNFLDLLLKAGRVQLAKHFGAEVTGVCSTSNVELVKSLGADFVIDYTCEDFTNNSKRYDIIFDTVGKTLLSDSLKSLKEGASYLQSVSAPALLIQMQFASMKSGKTLIGGTAHPRKEALEYLNMLVETGKIRPVIDCCYPFEQLIEAHRYVDSGHKKGNVITSL